MEDAGTEGSALLSTEWPSASAPRAGAAPNAKRVCLYPCLITPLTPRVRDSEWSLCLSCSSSSEWAHSHISKAPPHKYLSVVINGILWLVHEIKFSFANIQHLDGSRTFTEHNSISAMSQLHITQRWRRFQRSSSSVSDSNVGPGMLRMSLVICPPCSKLSSRLQERGNLCGSRNLQLSGGMAGRCLPHWWVQTGPSTHIHELFSISSSSPPVQPLFRLFIHSWDPHTSLPDWGVILMCLFRDVWVRDFQMWPKRDTETRLDSVASFWICDVRIYTSCKLSSTFSGFYKWFTLLFVFPLVCSRVHEALPERREVYLSWKVPLSPSVFWPSLRGEEEVTLVGLGRGSKVTGAQSGTLQLRGQLKFFKLHICSFYIF